jgi:ankyrin repeat protein
LQLLLKTGVDAKKSDDEGYTALHWAVRKTKRIF